MGNKLEPVKVKIRGEVRWKVEDRTSGKRERYFFATKSEAEDWRDERLDELKKFGTAVANLKPHERLMIADYISRLSKVGATLGEAVDFFLEHRRNVSRRVVLSDAVEEAIKAKEKSNKAKDYIRKFKGAVRGLRDSVGGGTFVHEVTTGQIQAFLDNPEWSPKTRAGKRIDVRTFFSYCVKNRMLTHNPALGIEPITLDDKEPGILTVPKIKKLLASCGQHAPSIIAYFALGLFGGLRPSEARRFSPDQIGDGFVEVSQKKIRSARRRFITLNPTLKAWLEHAVKKGFSMKDFRNKFDRVRTKAGDGKKLESFPWPDDCLRHSFASYHLAAFKNPDQTKHEMGHVGDSDVFYNHYRALVTPKDAEEFWALRPSE